MSKTKTVKKVVKKVKLATGEHSDRKSGRNSSGHFVKGNKVSVGNSGRPVEKNKKEYLEMMREFLTPEKWGQLIQIAFNDAVGDDAWARAKGREFFSKNVLPTKVELEFTGDVPVKIVAVEGFEGWGNNEN